MTIRGRSTGTLGVIFLKRWDPPENISLIFITYLEEIKFNLYYHDQNNVLPLNWYHCLNFIRKYIIKDGFIWWNLSTNF